MGGQPTWTRQSNGANAIASDGIRVHEWNIVKDVVFSAAQDTPGPFRDAMHRHSGPKHEGALRLYLFFALICAVEAELGKYPRSSDLDDLADLLLSHWSKIVSYESSVLYRTLYTVFDVPPSGTEEISGAQLAISCTTALGCLRRRGGANLDVIRPQVAALIAESPALRTGTKYPEKS